MAVDFKSLLSKPADSIEKPKPIPAGTYHGAIKSYEVGESKEKHTPYVRFHLTLASAGEDVDPASLEGIDLSKKTLRRDFYVTPDAEYRISELGTSCGIDVAGKSLGEVVAALQGASVLVEVTQRNSQDGQEIFNDVGKVSGA